MARIRQVKPDFFLDEEMAFSCSPQARLFFIGMWTLADREGRLEDRPARMKAQIFPYDDDITPSDITKYLDSLEHGGFITRYQVDGKRLICIRTFKKHQHFHRDEQASKLPEPKEVMAMHSASTVHAPYMHRACTPTSGNLVSGIGDRVSGAASQPDPPPKTRRRSPKTLAPDDLEITESMRSWAAEIAPGLDLTAETGKFLDHHRASGKRFSDWIAAWRTWIRRAPGYRSSAGSKPQPIRDTVGLADDYRPPPRDVCPNCNGTGRVLVVTDLTGGILVRAPWSETRQAVLAGPGEQIRAFRCSCSAGRQHKDLDHEPCIEIA